MAAMMIRRLTTPSFFFNKNIALRTCGPGLGHDVSDQIILNLGKLNMFITLLNDLNDLLLLPTRGRVPLSNCALS